MMKTLATICEEMQDDIRSKYDLGHGDAEELFKEIWSKMTSGPNGKPLQDAINQVDDAFSI